ncbi:MAG: YvcK family protein [Clostridia bacterium]|nr:YvcK family protein [Clostridia bacterium]
MKEMKIVTIGGGTGMSTMLRGLKKHTKNLTAIVTMADDGGGSGRLREDLGVLPPGDIRNCLVALADAEPIMEKLFGYRFSQGELKGQNVGNLIIAALDGMYGSFEEAILKVSEVLAISGRVLPVTTENVHISARLSDGAEILGESRIGGAKIAHGCKIEEISLVPRRAAAASGVIESIFEADAVILGPGSLYTSVIPNLLVEGVADALRETKATKIYVCNVMGQPGETEGYTAFEHVEALFRHGGDGLLDYCLVNTGSFDEKILKRYKKDGQTPVMIDEAAFLQMGITLIKEDLIGTDTSLARHNPDRLAESLMRFLSRVEGKKLSPIC